MNSSFPLNESIDSQQQAEITRKEELEEQNFLERQQTDRVTDEQCEEELKEQDHIERQQANGVTDEQYQKIMNAMLQSQQKLFEQQSIRQEKRLEKWGKNFLLVVLVLFIIPISISYFVNMNPPLDYVHRKEFESFRTEQQNSFTAFRKLVDEGQATKMLEEMKKYYNMIQNKTLSLPNHSIQNLMERR